VFELAIDTERYAPHFTAEIAGTKLPAEAILSVDVDDSIGKPSMFALNLNELLDPNTQLFTWLDSDIVAPGNEVSIRFGYPSRSATFLGKIKGITPSFPSSGTPTLRLEGYDLSHGMQKRESTFKDTEVTYSDVAMAIAQENGMEEQGIERTSRRYAVIKREKNESDYALLDRLAKDANYEFFVRNRTLYFRAPKDDQAARMSFAFRENIISFTPRLSSAGAVNELQITAWNPRSKKPITASATIADIATQAGMPELDKLIETSEGRKVTVRREGRAVESEDQAKALAIAELKRANKDILGGTLEIVGDPLVAPGMNIAIAGVGKKWFSGRYYVTGAKHSLSDGGYTTTLEVRRCL